ncbi:Ribose/xylose/arabinose/galactoside ABC-type transport system, permease component [Micromonospora pallida]|uniref:Ribose/xylose/arabinose/galactoside ABC-type transport system, permease component n=1 Tax=Micromonospora pallida TaxID=145854 RepID=A0A1C6TE32_9ACTN|nr:ABC transporter permease [Micromonospora pallida]SCL40031.1 Ribose/xylose/arabinose/galactoside ABC-type transport system, permease component [Micromonospora pallida]
MGYDEPGRGESVDRDQSGPATAVVAEPPTPAEYGPDRVAVHVAWEATLAVAVGVLGLLLWLQEPQALRGDGLRALLVGVVGLGLLALAAGLSLRTAAPNLAIGPVAVAAALHFAEQGDRGMTEAIVPAVVTAAVGGLVVAMFVVLLHVPAWAASLAAAAAVVGYVQRRQVPVLVQADYDPTPHAYHLFAGFLAVAVLGGLFGAIRPVRGLVGRIRPVRDPALRRGPVAAVVTAGALIGSTVMATLAGVLLAANGVDQIVPYPALDWTALGIGIALLGGTSAFGRRGGVSGTLLAVVLVGLFLTYVRAAGYELSRWAVAGTALAVGLVVTRLVETYGRPRPAAVEASDPGSGDSTISSGWALPGAGTYDTWPPALPANSPEDPVDPWGRWDGGGRDRWREDGEQDRWRGDDGGQDRWREDGERDRWRGDDRR